MEKRNHIEVCNLRESTSVLILEHIADWYALLILSLIHILLGIMITLVRVISTRTYWNIVFLHNFF